jgi:hypothetical protein
LSLNFVKNKVEKQHLSSMLPITMTMEISTNLKYLDNMCFITTLVDKLDLGHMISCQRRPQNHLIVCFHNHLEKGSSHV